MENGVCACGNPNCSSPGKHPRTPNGVHDATNNVEQVRAWWTQWPEANIGVAAGDFVILDVDGEKAIEALKNRKYPATPTVKTGSGKGAQLYFQAWEGARNAVKFVKYGKDGLDLRAEGGYGILPPSNHYTGGTYTWLIPPDIPIAQPPQWLLDLYKASAASRRLGPEKIPEVIRAGERNNTLFSLACGLRRRGLDEETIYAAIATVNTQRCDPPLPEKEVRQIAKSSARYQPASEDQVLSFLEFSEEKDLTPIDDEYINHARQLYSWNPWFYDVVTGRFYLYHPEKTTYLPCSEEELLAHYIEKLPATLRKTITANTPRNRLLIAMKIVGHQNRPKPPPLTWIKFLDTIVDIETGATHKPSPEYFFVNTIPWRLGDTEKTPTLDSLFTQWVNDKAPLLYEIIAYAIWREYPIHRVFILYGSGRNGKGSFIRVLRRFLGHENVASTELERLEKNRFETSGLYQKLVALCGETDYSTIRKSATLKALSGQDPVPGEFKFRNQFTFTNYAKIIVATNTLPMSMDTTDGFFSRMIIVDFPNTFDEGRDVLETIPEEEYQALARKSIQVLRGLLERGRFTGEGSIEEKRRRYEERANPLKAFVREFCEEEPDGYISSTEFYNEFKKWCKVERPRFRVPAWREDIKPLLESMGFETGVRKRFGDEQKRCIVGLRWKPASEGEECDRCDESDTSPFSNNYTSKKLKEKSVSQASHLSQKPPPANPLDGGMAPRLFSNPELQANFELVYSLVSREGVSEAWVAERSGISVEGVRRFLEVVRGEGFVEPVRPGWWRRAGRRT